MLVPFSKKLKDEDNEFEKELKDLCKKAIKKLWREVCAGNINSIAIIGTNGDNTLAMVAGTRHNAEVNMALDLLKQELIHEVLHSSDTD